MDKGFRKFPAKAIVTKEEVDERFAKVNKIVFFVILALIFALIAIIISVTGLFIDQMRYNNVAYRQYKTELQIQNELLERLNEDTVDTYECNSSPFHFY